MGSSDSGSSRPTSVMITAQWLKMSAVMGSSMRPSSSSAALSRPFGAQDGAPGVDAHEVAAEQRDEHEAQQQPPAS